jgi:hypothetical protein
MEPLLPEDTQELTLLAVSQPMQFRVSLSDLVQPVFCQQ